MPIRAAVAIPAYWVRSGGNTGDGRLILGGNGGLMVVDPARGNPLRSVAPVVVTDILLGGKPFPPDLFNEDAGSAVLNILHDANSVAVEFASLDYAGPDSNLYAYKLDGFDKDWVPTPATRRVASYTNLPPGDYTLELRGSKENRSTAHEPVPTEDDRHLFAVQDGPFWNAAGSAGQPFWRTRLGIGTSRRVCGTENNRDGHSVQTHRTTNTEIQEAIYSLFED